MNLEIIVSKPSLVKRPYPLLFVHGLAQQASVWQDQFMPFFTSHGYDCYAMSLRGHGKSDGRRWLHLCTLGSYVADLAQVCTQFENPPILIGHSMGGAVIQRYLTTHQCPAAILISTVPPNGLLKFFFRLSKNHFYSTVKGLLTLSTWPALNTIEKCKEIFFHNDTPDDIVRQFYDHVQDDSLIAFLQMVFQKLTSFQSVTTPLLVLGGDKDNLFSSADIKATARALQSDIKIFPDMPHQLLCGEGWQNVANYTLKWLNEKKL